MTNLPEPAAHLADALPLFTEAQMLQFRRDALEEAANEVESLPAYLTWFEYAIAIRKLMETT
jgi:hypothetical protein